MADIFQKLAIHLNNLPGGYPATDSGVEIRILKRLFSEKEAQIATGLTLFPEPASVISERLKMKGEQLSLTLDEMSKKGLIFRITKKNEPLYMAAQFIIGIWEYHVNDLSPDLIKDFNTYVPHLVRQWTELQTKQLRVIPISKSLSPDFKIMPYEVAEEIIQSKSKIVLAPCICRKEHAISGSGCDNPLETCLIFGSSAYYYEENGLGRPISQEQALQVLQQAIDQGLVLQPGNSQKTMNICMCCGCCCQVLKNIKVLPEPARAVNSNFFATVDDSLCVECGNCEGRCHMNAIVVNNSAKIDLKRCIGCGVCVPACDAGAIQLIAKPTDQQNIPPKSVFNTYHRIARERGLM